MPVARFVHGSYLSPAAAVRCSAGISCSKLLSKLVSGLHKPDDQTIILPTHAQVSHDAGHTVAGMGAYVGCIQQNYVHAGQQHIPMKTSLVGCACARVLVPQHVLPVGQQQHAVRFPAG